MDLNEAKAFLKQHKDESVVGVQTGQSKMKRSVADQSKIPSQYVYDYLIEPNPEYQAAQLEYQRAISNYNRTMADQSSSYVPGNMWASALVVGLNATAAGLASNAVEKARQKIAQTSPTKKVPQEKSYEYDKMTVEVKKDVPYTVYLINGRKVQKWRGGFTEQKVFTLAYNKKQEDTGSGYNSYDTEEDVERYEKAGVTIRGKDIAELLITKARGIKSDKSLAYLNPPANKNPMVAKKNKKATKSKVAGLMNSVVAIQDNGKNTIGTGFFVKKNIILTNRHVVDGKKLLTLHARGGKELLGKVIDVHHDLDLALIKVDGSGKPVRFYDREVVPGADVLAIGNPMGLEFSLTKGIVSNVRVREDESRPLAEKHLYIQTDVAINPGNSGGPLFLNGKVVGINTLKLVRKDVEGIGFAIHYDEILKFLKDTGHQVTPAKSQVVAKKKTVNKASSTKPEGIIKKMQDLKYLHDNQLISTEEYQLKKKKLLEAM